jgi:hypothetical protein
MDVRKHAGSTSSSSSSSSQQRDWSGRLDVDVLPLVSSKLDSPYVPGALQLSSICRSWRTAAGRVPVAAITWFSRQPWTEAEGTRRVQLVQQSFKPWLLKVAPQLDSFQLVINQADAEAGLVWELLEEAALAAAAAGAPLPLQQLQLPLEGTGMWTKLPAPLVAALPHLRSLTVPLIGGKQETAAFLKALGGLPHLTSLEVGLVGALNTYPWVVSDHHWQQLLQATPKQLQCLAVWVGAGEGESHVVCPKYTWKPLAAFPHLKQLQLKAVCAEDLSPLAALPALTSLGLQWSNRTWQPLVGVKGVLRELEVATVAASNQEHLQQLTALTSLTLRETAHDSILPQQVASGLQRLDWGVRPEGSSSSSSSGPSSRIDLLRHCSSSNLRELQLTGRPWFPDWTASEALQRLTGLTCFGLHAKWSSGEPPTTLSLKRWSLAIQYVKQLRRLEVPAPLLATGGAWLGGLPHLTSLRLTAEWPHSWPVGLRQGVADPQVLSQLRSCSAGLQVLEVHLDNCDRESADPPPDQVVPVVRQLLQREVPGVQLLVTWEEFGDMDGGSGMAFTHYSDSSDTNSDADW